MANPQLYRGFRYLSEIINQVVWLYFRFALNHTALVETLQP